MRKVLTGMALVLSVACGTPTDSGAPVTTVSGEATDAPSPAAPSPATPSSLPEAPTTAAECSMDAYREAVARDIDGGHFPISGERCDGKWAAFDVDFGAGACPPEDHSCRGQRVHRTFWRSEDGDWVIITYQGSGDCAEVWRVDPRFPEAICERP